MPLVTQPDILAVAIDPHTGPHNASIHQGDGHDALGKDGDITEVLGDNPLIRSELLFQCLTAHKITLLRQETHSELGRDTAKTGMALFSGSRPIS